LGKGGGRGLCRTKESKATKRSENAKVGKVYHLGGGDLAKRSLRAHGRKRWGGILVRDKRDVGKSFRRKKKEVGRSGEREGGKIDASNEEEGKGGLFLQKKGRETRIVKICWELARFGSQTYSKSSCIW